MGTSRLCREAPLAQRSVLRILCVVALALFVLPAHIVSAQSRHDPAKPALIVGYWNKFPPYSFDNDQGQGTGFVLDVWRAVAGQSGTEVTYRGFDSGADVLAALEAGQVDLAVGVPMTPATTKRFDFSEPIESSEVRIFVRATTHDIRGVDDLKGRKVAAALLRTMPILPLPRGEIEFVEINDVKKALNSLLSGQTDAFVFPENVVRYFAVETTLAAHLKSVGPPLIEVKRGIAVRRGNTALLARINPAILNFVSSSRYRQLILRWFGEPESFWTTNRILIGAGIGAFMVLVCLLAWRHCVLIATNRRLMRQIEERTKNRE